MAGVADQQQVSISIDEEGIRDNFENDEREVTSRARTASFSRFGSPGLRLDSEGTEIKTVGNSFLSGLHAFRTRTKVVDVYLCCCLETTRARRDAFRVHKEAVARKRGGHANVKKGWYGGSREEIGGIVAHGFTLPAGGGGVCISAAERATDAVIGTEVDESGMRHVLMCGVILGNQEETVPGSDQSYPSSMEFHTGVDCLNEPKMYIVWSAYINVYILPIYVVGFKIDIDPRPQGLLGMRGVVEERMRSTSELVMISNFVTHLGRNLTPYQKAQINKCYKDYCEKRTGRQEMIFKLMLIGGRKLLAATEKHFGDRVGEI